MIDILYINHCKEYIQAPSSLFPNLLRRLGMWLSGTPVD